MFICLANLVLLRQTYWRLQNRHRTGVSVWIANQKTFIIEVRKILFLKPQYGSRDAMHCSLTEANFCCLKWWSSKCDSFIPEVQECKARCYSMFIWSVSCLRLDCKSPRGDLQAVVQYVVQIFGATDCKAYLDTIGVGRTGPWQILLYGFCSKRASYRRTDRIHVKDCFWTLRFRSTCRSGHTDDFQEAELLFLSNIVDLAYSSIAEKKEGSTC